METTEALKLARIARQDWDALLQRGQYPVAPKTRQGKSRVFSSRDLAAAVVLGQLLEHEVKPGVAAAIACEVRRQLEADHTIDMLSAWKVAKRTGKPRVVVAVHAPTPTAIELFQFDILAIRSEVLIALTTGKRDCAKAET